MAKVPRVPPFAYRYLNDDAWALQIGKAFLQGQYDVLTQHSADNLYESDEEQQAYQSGRNSIKPKLGEPTE